jgi:hypothetical protein
MSTIKLKQEFVGKLKKEDVKLFLTLKYPHLSVGYYGWVVTITKNFAIRIQISVSKKYIELVSDVSQTTKVISFLTLFIAIIVIGIVYSKERRAFMKEIKDILQEEYGN